MQLVIDTADTHISVKDKGFFIQNKQLQRRISPKRVSSIAVLTNCTINAAAIRLAAQHQVPILFFNNFGTIQARLWSPYFVNLSDLRKKQLVFSDTTYALEWMIDIFRRKLREQQNNLKYLAHRTSALEKETTESVEKMQAIFEKVLCLKGETIAKVRDLLMGYEGSISRQYFKTLSLSMPDLFRFERRSRRPALDMFNSGLNYLYGMTYSVVEGGVFAKGLDPFIGLLHVDFYNRPTLVFDLIEPVRPVVDRIWIDLILSGDVLEEHFVRKDQGFWLAKKGKRLIIPSFNKFLHQRIKVGDIVKRFKDHIYEEANALGNYIHEVIELP